MYYEIPSTTIWQIQRAWINYSRIQKYDNEKYILLSQFTVVF